MAGRRVGALLLLLGAACGRTTVERRIDALLRSGARFAHQELPSPERLAELYPDSEGFRGKTHGIRRDLRANEHAAAILRAGESAVPELSRLLEDPERAQLAAVFLAEIGGREAASALLARWRELRGTFEDRSVYHHRDGKTYGGGIRHEGAFAELYSELIPALCYTGREVAGEVAADTSAAMDEAERLQLAGASMLFEERVREPEGEVTLRWTHEPVEAACEGLKVLAMSGAPEGVDLFVRALRSPVRSFRWEAIQYHTYLGHGRDRTLPILGSLLDDPEWRGMALEEIATLVAREALPKTRSPAEEEALVARYKRKLQDLGHLPR